MVATSSQNKIKHVLGKQHTQHCKSGLFLQIILQRLGFIIDGVNSVWSEEKHLYFFNILYNDVPAVLRTVFLVDSSSQCTQLQNIIAIIFVFQGT